MTEADDQRVVIGVDGSAGSQNAVRWGLDLAERRGDSVRLLHAYDPAFGDPRIGGGYDAGTLTEMYDAAVDQLEAARALASDSHPGLVITTGLVDDSPAAALIDESTDADVVVMGAHGVSAFSTLVAGSTTMNVATYALCPVVAVPSGPAQAFGGHGVVVGVDGSEPSHHALDFAFREAAETDSALIAVLAWMDPVTPAVAAAAFPTHEDPTRWLRQANRELLTWVEPWAHKYPDVRLHRRVVHEHPVRALTSAADGAQLLVVGCRGQRAVGSMLLGSVSHGVLHLASCPVSVVHHHG